ncbi:translocation/assembly module TamB domain-containing protein [Marimonas arenosa]|uniref:Translocation/assembly module TamB domain-containing protein n=1 Tax=Marimonas arenosa TaxID=1795305 RepID=A0AAE4B5G8_9RHOB|nr:translocation/assembly module TamB domain-containing protein [Marimonas arenosa]MDQ2091147.1 translocation/assembly module TamB domain-containing protein [Marimonas arenosa]
MRVLVLLVLLLVPVSALAQQEQSDRGYVQGLLEDALSAPGRTVRLEGFEGALSSRATIKQVTVTDPKGLWLTASDLVLSWNRAALLRGRIEIAEITIGRINLPRRAATAEPALPKPEARGAFALPELPVSVDIAKMQIKEAVLGKALFGEAARVSFAGKANLEGGAGTATLEIRRLDKTGQFRLAGGFDNATRVLALDLGLAEPAGGIAANLLNLPGKPSIALTVRGEDPISAFRSVVRLATDGQDRLTGGVTLTTDGDGATRFAAALGGDLAPVLAPEFAEFLGDDLQLVADGRRGLDGGFVLDRLRLDTAAVRIDGAAEITAEGWPQSFVLDGRITPPVNERVVLPLPGPRSAIRAASFKATFDADEGEAWQIDGRAEGLVQDGFAIGAIRFSGDGAILRQARSISGVLQMALDGIAPADPGLAQAIGGSLRGGLAFGWAEGTPLRMRDIALTGPDYGLSGVVSVSGLTGTGALTVVPDVVLRARDLARFAKLARADLTGGAELAITGRAEPLTGNLALRFNGQTQNLAAGIARLDPLLAGVGKLTLGLERDVNGTRLVPFVITTEHARIDLAADLRSRGSSVSIKAAVAELGRILPDMPGEAELIVTARQDGQGWAVEAEADLPGETRAAFDGMIDSDLRTRLTARGRLDAEIENLSGFSGLVGRRLSGSASMSSEGEADLLTGAFDIQANGRTQALDIGIPTIAPLLRGATQFSLSAEREAQGALRLHNLALNSPGLEAAAQGRLAAGEQTVDYRVALSNLAVLIPDLPGPAGLNGTATLRGGDWVVDAKGYGPGGIAFDAVGQVAGTGARIDGRVSGQVPLALANARLRGQALSGLAQVDLAINGAPALRSLTGRVTVNDARFADPALNLALNRIRGQAELANGQAQLALDADVSSGGRVRVSGPVSLAAPYNAAFEVGLVDVTLRDTTLFEANLSGRVSVDGPLRGGARIGGVIDVATAELQIPQFGPSYSALDGLRHLNPSPAVRRTLHYSGLDQAATSGARLPGFPLDLLIRAPNRVFVRGRGLDAELGGTLRLTGTTSDIVPVGRFELIRGRLDVLTRRLVLTEGSVRMRGSFDPVISFAATSQVEDLAVSLRLDGVASAPELTVTSVPELPQEEALSFFLFGRDATGISPFQAIQLAAAIRTLSGQGGIGLTGQLRQSLGVDELDFGTDAEGTAQARVGKYISEKIYTDVTVKSDGTSQINLNLEISPTVKMRGRLGSDGDSGIGVFYERDY